MFILKSFVGIERFQNMDAYPSCTPTIILYIFCAILDLHKIIKIILEVRETCHRHRMTYPISDFRQIFVFDVLCYNTVRSVNT
jgi:hypothetical protein